MAAKSYKIDFKVEKAQFEAKLKKLVEVTGKSSRYWIIEGAKAFLQSTVKATPITQKVKEPRINEQTNPNAPVTKRVTKSTYRYRPVYQQGKKGACYRVPYWTLFSRGWKTFTSRSAAREFALIRNRGVARAAWIQAGKYAKLPNVQYKQSGKDKIEPSALSIDAYSSAFWSSRGGTIPSSALTMTNRIKDINSYGWIAAKIGMRKAKNRMNQAIKEYKEKVKTQWR